MIEKNPSEFPVLKLMLLTPPQQETHSVLHLPSPFVKGFPWWMQFAMLRQQQEFAYPGQAPRVLSPLRKKSADFWIPIQIWISPMLAESFYVIGAFRRNHKKACILWLIMPHKCTLFLCKSCKYTGWNHLMVRSRQSLVLSILPIPMYRVSPFFSLTDAVLDGRNVFAVIFLV